MFAQLCLTAQYQRDVDSERMTGLMQTIYKGGGHRGPDPYGYATVRDDRGRVAKPRTLRIVEPEAEVIRRVWTDLAAKSTKQIASELNAEGVPRRNPGPWTKNTVKDIVERGRFYLGFVVLKRGVDERPGRHEAIIDESTWAVGRKAADARMHGRRERGPKRRTYLIWGSSCASAGFACAARLVCLAARSGGTTSVVSAASDRSLLLKPRPWCWSAFET